LRFSEYFDGYAMRYERHNVDDNGLAEVWRNAQARRFEDIYCWFATIFKTPSHFRSVIADVGAFFRAFAHPSEPLARSPSRMETSNKPHHPHG
jgi:hypothetical protein